MKKVIILIGCLILMVTTSTISYSATIDVQLITEKEEIKIAGNDSQSFTVTIKLGDFVNIQENTVLGYTATLDYDESIFEEAVIIGKNGWNTSYNKLTHVIEGDTDRANANSEIAQIIFTINNNYSRKNQSTTIKLNNIVLTDGDFEINGQREITIKIANENTSNNSIQKITDLETVVGEATYNSKVSISQAQSLPNAGIKRTILITISILIIAAIIFKIKSRKIKY